MPPPTRSVSRVIFLITQRDSIKQTLFARAHSGARFACLPSTHTYTRLMHKYKVFTFLYFTRHFTRFRARAASRGPLLKAIYCPLFVDISIRNALAGNFVIARAGLQWSCRARRAAVCIAANGALPFFRDLGALSRLECV